jgi:polysaccharide export outer membrane protein
LRSSWITVAIVLGLTGCGTVYKTADVIPSEQEGSEVAVKRITAQSLAEANRSTYQPKGLPQVFRATAASGSALRGAGALPEPPLEPEAKPAKLALRLPPEPPVEPYQIGVGDVVLLSTPSASSTVEELSGLLAAQNSRQGYTVQDDGSINIPNVGRVRIADMTIEEAEAELFQQLANSQLDPVFSLEISEFNSKKIAIGGAVANPGVVPVSLTPLYLDEALSAAGGIEVADIDYASVRLYRGGTLYQIPLSELYSHSGLQRTRLIDGDSVFVDSVYDLEGAQRYFEQQIELINIRQAARVAALNELTSEVELRRAQLEEARANYRDRKALGAEDADYVYLAGEVGKQSRYALPFERRANLADALYDSANGVAAKTGDYSQIYVLRAAGKSGGITAWQLDARNAANLALATRFELRPNDVVFVAEQPVTRWGRTISQITPALITTTIAAASN